ncbi:MAG TPA: S8 family serine peptidase [Bacteroidia bacterium]|nr:S8 family serine peptidase [Bacteroidia bacterium]
MGLTNTLPLTKFLQKSAVSLNEKLRVFFAALALSVNFFGFGQYYVNTTGIIQYGNPGNVENVRMVLDPNTGDRVIISSKVVGSKSQIHLSSISQTGVLSWEQTFTGSTSYDNYGADVKVDNNGYIYFCGKWQTTNHSDIILVKYDPSNSSIVWQQIYNGISSGNDAPAAMVLDGSGNIYITGSSCNAGSAPDYCTLKYNNSGTLQWVTNYDHIGLPDAATVIHLDNSSGDVYVSGTSVNALSTSTNADITTIRYDNNGNQINLYRHGFGGDGIDFVTEMAVGGNGYLNLACNHADGNNKYFSVIQLTPTLSVNWADSSNTQISEATSIATDASDNVITVGHQRNSYGGSDLIIYKHSPTGGLAWKKEMPNQNPSDFMKARRIRVDGNNNYVITGDGVLSTGKDFITLVQDQNGETLWLRYNNSYGVENDVSYDLALDGNDIYVIGVSTIAASNALRTLRYTYGFKPKPTASYPTGGCTTLPHQFLIRFQPSKMNNTNCNNKNVEFGYLADFLSSGGISEFNSLVGADGSRWPAYKTFPNMTNADTISIGRDGDSVKILPFYATLLVEFPSSTVDTSMVKIVRAGCNLVQAADLNYLIDLYFTNDPYYVNGSFPCLDATGSYTASNINVTPAWATHSGSANIIVGVFDSGINYTHPDFMGSNIQTSKILTGRDYYNNVNYLGSLPVDRLGHGSGVAGLIAAIRNNSVGIAGVAGGDAINFNDGVSLHDMKLFEGNNLTNNPAYFTASYPDIVHAIVDGAISNPAAGIGLAQHIQNHSWGMAPSPPQTYEQMKEALRTAFENEVLLSFSSGNNVGTTFTPSIYNMAANFKDEFCLCVGGIDATGYRWADNASVGSCGGPYLDFVAASTPNQYSLLKKNGSGITDSLWWGVNDSQKRQADGTSFSAPLASGVSALLMSYVNNHPQKPNNIAPEDIEKIIEKYASAIPTYATPWDPQVGFGRINAGKAMQKIELPWYQLKHFNLSIPMASTNINFIDTESVYYSIPWNGMGPGYGVVLKYEVTYTTSHNIGSNVLLDAWKRDAKSNLKGNVSVPLIVGAQPGVNDIPCETDITLTSFSSSSANFKGYVYKVLNTYSATPTHFWYPFDPFSPHATAKFAYTLYYMDSTMTNVNEKRPGEETRTFPNPSNGQVTIKTISGHTKKASIRVFDLTGRLLLEIPEAKYDTDTHQYLIDLIVLNNGLYLVNLKTDDGRSETFKQIIAK